jgi:hypothetical protein
MRFLGRPNRVKSVVKLFMPELLRYADDVRDLETLLNRDLAQWLPQDS